MSVERSLDPFERDYLARLARQALVRHEKKEDRLPGIRNPAARKKVAADLRRRRKFIEGAVDKTAPWLNEARGG